MALTLTILILKCHISKLLSDFVANHSHVKQECYNCFALESLFWSIQINFICGLKRIAPWWSCEEADKNRYWGCPSLFKLRFLLVVEKKFAPCWSCEEADERKAIKAVNAKMLRWKHGYFLLISTLHISEDLSSVWIILYVWRETKGGRKKSGT